MEYEYGVRITDTRTGVNDDYWGSGEKEDAEREFSFYSQRSDGDYKVFLLRRTVGDTEVMPSQPSLPAF